MVIQAPTPVAGSDMQFVDRIAMVTGASRGVGLAVVQKLVEGGAQVLMVDNEEQALQEAVLMLGGYGGAVLPITGDVGHKVAVDFMVGEVVARYGHLDILVCCHNSNFSTPLELVDEEEWNMCINTNLTGTFLCDQAAAEYMKPNGYGRIVNVTSQAGKTLGCYGGAHYHAAKAGILGFTRQAAKELGPFAVTCNAVCIGAIESPDFHDGIAGQQLRLNTPLKRLGTAEEAASVICFLASESSGYVTGATFDVNGGDVMA